MEVSQIKQSADKTVASTGQNWMLGTVTRVNEATGSGNAAESITYTGRCGDSLLWMVIATAL